MLNDLLDSDALANVKGRDLDEYLFLCPPSAPGTEASSSF